MVTKQTMERKQQIKVFAKIVWFLALNVECTEHIVSHQGL
mgnify:CR=1 FL=1